MKIEPDSYVAAIRASGLTIYDPVEIGSRCYIPSRELEILLDRGLRGLSTANLPIKTRSKIVKSRVCEVLGYPIPKTFTKTRPRFPGQNFDTYVQKANNLQIWNEEVFPTRRYVVIREIDGALTRVRVVTGESLALLDTTGTLTKKYQARVPASGGAKQLISGSDTPRLRAAIAKAPPRAFHQSPTNYPEAGCLLPIQNVYSRLTPLIGVSFPDAGRDQERLRGAELHRLVCRALGYTGYADDGRFPDVKHQLLEVKLQTSPTIDLGLVTPASTEPLDIPKLDGVQVRHCDVRYAVFGAVTDGISVQLNRLFLTTGADFFTRFEQFQGKVLNAKLQLPLPRSFFDAESLADVVV